MGKFIQIIGEWFQRLTTVQKRWLAVICTVIFSILLTISVLSSMRGSGEDEIYKEGERLRFISPIPPEELFLPDEPDYLPGVILGREQRSSWTEEDAAEYWQDPLRHGEEQWRVNIEAAIDEFLERVP